MKNIQKKNKIRKPFRRVKITSFMKMSGKRTRLNPRMKRKIFKNKGKFVGYCPDCKAIIMCEDQMIGLDDKGIFDKVLDLYHCPKCGKMHSLSSLKQPIYLTGKWFTVVETKEILFRVVAPDHKKAIEYVKTREWFEIPIVSTTRRRAIRVKPSDTQFTRWSIKEGIEESATLTASGYK